MKTDAAMKSGTASVFFVVGIVVKSCGKSADKEVE